jgi:hypothetical protein
MAHKALGSRKLIGNRSFQTFGSISGTPINPVHFGQVFLGIPKLTGKPITFWNSWGLERFSSQILGWEPTCRTFLVGLIGFKYQRIQHIVNTCKYMLNPCQLRFGSCSYIYIHIFICIHMCIYIYISVCVCSILQLNSSAITSPQLVRGVTYFWAHVLHVGEVHDHIGCGPEIWRHLGWVTKNGLNENGTCCGWSERNHMFNIFQPSNIVK